MSTFVLSTWSPEIPVTAEGYKRILPDTRSPGRASLGSTIPIRLAFLEGASDCACARPASAKAIASIGNDRLLIAPPRTRPSISRVNLSSDCATDSPAPLLTQATSKDRVTASGRGFRALAAEMAFCYIALSRNPKR